MSDGAQDDKLLAAVTGDTAYLVVRGRATFKISPGVKTLFTSLAEKGIQQFILDMSDCPGMDSTFMGVVAGQAIRLKPSNGSVIMIHLSPYLRG
ncbi:MAG: STAS domain-containing protein, partial [Kiritimatiellae bacterium]|nr:STAS domain-containing protein [Kiritimatiellia bacterium]